MSLGSLRVLLGLDAAEFTTGLTKAEARLKNTEQQVKKFSSTLQKDIAFGVGKAVAALTALDRVGGFLIRFGFDAINAAASFEDLGEKTGGSAEKLASFQTAADITKTSMESVGEALVKLTKGLAGADEETKGAANAVQKLGFNLAEFKELDSATQFEQLAKRLNEFADSNTKTSAAVQLFGKAGANQLSLMKELANQTERSTILTKAHIKTADDFADKQAKVTSELKQYVGVVGIAVLPVLTELSKAFVDVIKNMTEMDKATGTLKASNAVRDWAETTAIAIATLAESLAGIAKLIRAVGGSFQAVGADISFAAEALAEGPSALINRDASKIKSALAERNKIVEEANQRYVDLWNYNGTAVSDALRKNFALRRELERDIAGGVAPGESTVSIAAPKPKLPDWFGGGKSGDKATKAAQEAKKLLDKQLSDIDNFIKAEKRIFETRESDLARLYQSDQISIAAYFDERLAALDRNTTATVELYDKQIKAQEAFAAAAKRRKDEPAVIDAQKQIGDIQAKIEDVLHEKQQRKLKLQDDLTQAAGDYADQVTEVRARVLELLGTEEAALQAAKLRFDIQNRSVIKGAKREKDPALEADIAALRQQNDAQTQINNLLKDAGVIEQNLATAQAKLHLERDLGMRDEIDTLGLVGKASGEAAEKLRLIAEQYLAIAVASGKPEIIANALALKQRVDELAAATDILAAKIRQTFVETGASAIETFLNSVAEGKNVLDSFANAFKQFANDIIRQINRIAAQKIADSLFKSSSGGGDGGIFGSIADAFVSYVGGLSRQEKGGPVSGHTPYIVGERGPEIFVPRTVAAEATKQIDSLIAQKGKPVEYTDRVKAATVATNLPHLIGAKGPEIFVPKMDGVVIPNDKVNKLSRVLQGRAKGGPVVSATPYIVGERGPEIFTPRNAATLGPHEKVVTRLVSSVQPKASQVASNMPRVVGARGPELFVSKAAGIIIPHDKVAKLALERKTSQASAAPARRREISASLAAARTILRDEKIITRYANAPYSRPVAAHVPYIGRREIFIPKSANAAVQRDEAVSKLSSDLQKQGRGTSFRVTTMTLAGVAHGTKSSAQTGWPPGSNLSKTSASVASRIIHERAPQVYIQQSAKAIQQSRRAVAELVADVPRQRRVGPVSARTPYVVGEHGREIFIPKSASATVQRDQAISKLSTTFQKQGRPAHATRIINERQIYIQKSASAIQQSKRAVAELVANAPRQRRAGGGPVAARTPYVVGELGPELFVPKSASRIIKHEKKIDDLVSNTIQHRASSGPNITYVLGDREIFISKLASVSNIAQQHSASVKNERVQNDLVSNKRNEKIINQLVSNIQRGSFAAHQTYLINEREIPKSARKVIADDKAVTRVRSPLLERRQHQLVEASVVKHEKVIDDLVSNTTLSHKAGSVAANVLSERGHEIFISKLVSTDIKNEKFISDLVSNTVQRRAIGSPIATRTPYIVDKFGAEVFMPKAAANHVQELRNVRGSHYGLFPALELGLTSAHTPLRALNFKETDHVSIASSRINKNEMVHNDLVSNTRNEKTINQLVSNIQRRTELESYGQKDRRADNSGRNFAQHLAKTLIRGVRPRDGGSFAARQTYLIGERRPELVVTKSAEKIIKNENLVSKLITNNVKRNEKIINDLVANSVRSAESVHQTHLVGEHGREIFVAKSASNSIKNKKIVDDLVSNVQRRAIGGPVAAHQTYLVGELGPEPFVQKLASKIIKNETLQNDLVSNTHNEKTINQLISNQRRPSASSQLVDKFVPKSASKVIKNEKVIYDLVTNTIQHKAQGVPVQARQTYVVGERGRELFVTSSAEKIIKNESRVSELVTNNARRNEKVINDLVSKTAHHRQRSVTAPDVAAKIIKNESRISELVSNDVQRNEEIINRLATTTRREGGRSNQLLVVGAHGPELFIPKAAGNIIKNERRINELVSNIEHRNIDRSSEKTIDEIIASTVQRRAQGGPVSAYQKYLVGERGPELYVPRDRDKAGGIKVPSDFFTNEQYRRARGGAVVANRPYIVGERGPETFIPKTAGRIVQSTNTNSNTFVFNMSGGVGMNRQTQQQLFADAAQAFSRSNRRLN